jgi:hypothetical protein
LKAIYYLQQAGYAGKVTHVSGGLGEWLREDLPTTLDEDVDDNSDDDNGALVGVGRGLLLPSFFARK